MLLIRNARVLDPASGRDERADILLEGGLVRAIGRDLPVPAGARVIDAAGLIAAPGLIDVHSHFRDPGQTYKEDIFSGARAAAKGGYTAVICMANTVPPVDSPEVLAYVRGRAEKACIRVLQAATLTCGMAGKELVDMEGLLAAGAAGFTDDGRPVMDEALLRTAFERAAKLGAVISLHEEDPAFVARAGVNRGAVSAELGFPGADRAAEDTMVARDARLALLTGARVDFQHISSAGAVEAIRRARALGADVWGEATPHHFSLTEEAVLTHGAYAKMNPPLRTEADRQAIIEGLRDGTLRLIATDHAPHSKEEKDRGLFEAPSGIVGLETALALAITNLVKPGHLTMSEMLDKLTAQPAELYGLPGGRLQEGGPADLVLFDPEEEWTVTEESFASRSKNSPFIGTKLTGRVRYTVCGGEVVFEEERHL